MNDETKTIFNDGQLIERADERKSSNYMEKAQFIDKKVAIIKKEEIYVLNVEEQLCVIHICKKFNISINKPLIPLRIALFLWYGAAKIPLSYFSVFMKQKGLSLVEYSSLFTVTFVFQFLTAFLSGIVADKIGNAKPVLIFHILITMLTVLSFIFAPTINNCDSIHGNNTQINVEKHTSDITLKVEDMGETFQNRLGTFNESEVLSDESFTTYISPRTTCFKEGKGNFTTPNVERLESKCEKRSLLILYVITTMSFFSSWSSVYRFMDVTVMSLVKRFNTSFGYERFFSISGDVFITFIAGIVLSTFTSTGEENNYQSVYWFSVCMFCFVLVAVHSIKIQIKPPSKNMWKKGLTLIRDMDIVVFIVVIFILGTFCSFFDSFTVWFLEDLNASTVVLGLQQTLNALYGLPFSLTSKWWLKIFGTEKLFIVAFLGYIIYGIALSCLYDPWWSLLIEASSALTYHLLWIAAVVHSHRIAPEELVSTVIASAGAIHFGVGRSSGTVTGGLIINAVGPRITFRIFAGLSTMAATLYALFLYCFNKK